MANSHQAPILFLPHGGGPLPLLGDPGHRELTEFLRAIPEQLGTPEAIVVFSAHWETDTVSVTSAPNPALIYDYYGFPDESYTLSYPAPGAPELAQALIQQLREAGIDAAEEPQRGFDHGVFVPLKLMYPAANIPCIQLSLSNSLDPAQHLAIGQALAPLRSRNILFIGSGLSFHNMQLFRSGDNRYEGDINHFHDWLLDTCTNPELDAEARSQRLQHWDQAPGARLCHPREEHLLPLHLCAGVASSQAAEVVFDGPVLGHRAVGLLWR
ncbi:DODA-type extradiol aromatic ring-opening family dioxygenase [Marinobacter zhejiangensis]|uniref:Aromatic ring-opening dioxygenase, catalytic subunit, LigB family n=1 Tax=Marinobacter zhejiangensis TaxID=488535 RepID=A0A1I4LXK6_9GAMM|nr:class III extradiol ring-cleavage dioxygenase [Marinobacter zhejiangensis]SFL95526.1 Aromatic ring-opening dioxygenase, catalytic subunit, LigB family [Marinobacter zhejiangensis]